MSTFQVGCREENVSSTSTAETQMLALFRKLVEGLPSGTAALEVHSHRERGVKGARLEIRPSLHAAARIAVLVLDTGAVFLTLGRATSFEFQLDQGPPHDQSLEEIEALCKAIIGGKLEENLWLAGSEVFRCSGKIALPSGNRTTHYRGSFHPFERVRRKQVKYLPYVISGP
jgi:hypothetical protein